MVPELQQQLRYPGASSMSLPPLVRCNSCQGSSFFAKASSEVGVGSGDTNFSFNTENSRRRLTRTLVNSRRLALAIRTNLLNNGDIALTFENIKYAITVCAIILLFFHIFWPNLGIDITTIALLFVAALPFSGSLLKSLASSGVKNLELPGGIKIELTDTKAATDKIIRGWANVSLSPLQVSAKDTISTPDKNQEKITSEDPISYIREVANNDSNLSLVAFRIEVEKRLRKLAENYQIQSYRTSLGRLIRELRNKQLLPPEVASGLMDLLALGNRAAHGVEVSQNAADWVLDVGSSIILELDNLLSSHP